MEDEGRRYYKNAKFQTAPYGTKVLLMIFAKLKKNWMGQSTCTNILDVHKQISPWLRKLALTSAGMALSSLASLNTTAAFFPPSSRLMRFIIGPDLMLKNRTKLINTDFLSTCKSSYSLSNGSTSSEWDYFHIWKWFIVNLCLAYTNDLFAIKSWKIDDMAVDWIHNLRSWFPVRCLRPLGHGTSILCVFITKKVLYLLC